MAKKIHFGKVCESMCVCTCVPYDAPTSLLSLGPLDYLQKYMTGFLLQCSNKKPRHNPHTYQIGTGLISHSSSVQHDAVYTLNKLVGSVFIK